MIRLATLVITLGVVAAGSWWTALAIRDGETGAFLLRFSLVVMVGTYYLVLYRIQGRFQGDEFSELSEPI